MGVPTLAAVRAALDAPAAAREQYRPEDIQAFGVGSAAGQLPPRMGLGESAESPSGAFDFEFGRPYNANMRHLTGAEYDLREFRHPERLEFLRRAHQAWERNPYAKAGVRLIRNFTVRTGHTVTTKATQVQRVIDAFRQDPLNRIQQYDKELCDQLLIDGEVFLRFNDPPRTRPSRLQPRVVMPPPAPRDSQGTKRGNDGGDDREDGGSGDLENPENDKRLGAPISNRVVVDPIPPWWVEDLVLDPDFRVIVRSYRVRFRRGASLEDQGMAQELEDVPADRVLHVAINKLGYELRGRSELLPILPWLKAYKDFLEDRVRINRLKGAMLYDVTIKGSQPGTIQAKRAQYRTPPPPNSVVIHSDAETWATVDNKINAQDSAEDGRQIKLATAVGFGLPEYALGDGENANRATASSQQLPMLANFADYQDTLGHFWHEVYEFVIDGAIEAGILEPYEQEVDSNGETMLDPLTGAPKMVDVHEAFGVEYPPPDEGDPKNLAEALAILSQNGWIDDESAIQETGRDPVVIMSRLRAQEAAEMERVAQGLAFPPNGVGGPDLWGLTPEGDPLPPGEGPAAKALQQRQQQNQPGRGGQNGNSRPAGRSGSGSASSAAAARRPGSNGAAGRRGNGGTRRESAGGEPGEGGGSGAGDGGAITPAGLQAIALRAEAARAPEGSETG